MKWSAIHLDFSHFGKILRIAHGIAFHVLRGFHTKVDFHLGIGMLHNMLQVNRDHIEINCNLGESNCTFRLVVVWPMHHGNFQFLNQVQMKLARAFCIKFVPNVPCHALN